VLLRERGLQGAISRMEQMRVAGILLAAGSGSRFGGDKLLARLSDGTAIGVRAAANLVTAIPSSIAVVRPDDAVLAAALAAAGIHIVHCADAHAGMGASLAHAVRMTDPDVDGYVVALADMPWIETETIRRVAAAITREDSIVVPRHAGQRGHPVGFGRGHRAALLASTGDAGARSLLTAAAASIEWLEVDDPAIVRDVDVPADLRAC